METNETRFIGVGKMFKTPKLFCIAIGARHSFSTSERFLWHTKKQKREKAFSSQSVSPLLRFLFVSCRRSGTSSNCLGFDILTTTY